MFIVKSALFLETCQLSQTWCRVYSDEDLTRLPSFQAWNNLEHGSIIWNDVGRQVPSDVGGPAEYYWSLIGGESFWMYIHIHQGIWKWTICWLVDSYAFATGVTRFDKFWTFFCNCFLAFWKFSWPHFEHIVSPSGHTGSIKDYVTELRWR